MKNIIIVATTPLTIETFLLPVLPRTAGYRYTFVSNFDLPLRPEVVDRGWIYIAAPFHRRIQIFADLWSLIVLIRILKRSEPNLIYAITPKALFLTALAKAFSCPTSLFVPIFTGQVWAGTGFWRSLMFRCIDSFIHLMSDISLVDGYGQMKFLERMLFIPKKPAKFKLIGRGSICGVDLKRFKRDSRLRGELRTALGIPKEAVVVLFVGRLTVEKGFNDLVGAFTAIQKSHGLELRLLVVGDYESVHPKPAAIAADDFQGLIRFPWCNDVEKFYSMADVFVLPSYREGFGNVFIEAAAAGLPVVCYDIYGNTSSVLDGLNGVRVGVGDHDALIKAMLKYINNRRLRVIAGREGRKLARASFDQSLRRQFWQTFQLEILNGT